MRFGSLRFIHSLLVLCFTLGIRPIMGLLNSNVAGLGSPEPFDADLIDTNVRFVSSFASIHFFIVDEF